MPWGQDLFRILDRTNQETRWRFTGTLNSGTGPVDPTIEIHLTGTLDAAQVSELVLSHLACHYLLSLLPDRAIKETMDYLVDTLNFYTKTPSIAQSQLSSLPISITMGSSYVRPEFQAPED
jgi:hypothetical protein